MVLHWVEHKDLPALNEHNDEGGRNFFIQFASGTFVQKGEGWVDILYYLWMGWGAYNGFCIVRLNCWYMGIRSLSLTSIQFCFFFQLYSNDIRTL